MFTIPTSEQIGITMRDAAYLAVRIIAYAVVLGQMTWEAGYRTGKAVHSLNDWLAEASHKPVESLTRLARQAIAWANRVLVLAEPQPQPVPILTGPELLELWGAEILPDEPTPTRKRTVRRKPATARKAKAAG